MKTIKLLFAVFLIASCTTDIADYTPQESRSVTTELNDSLRIEYGISDWTPGDDLETTTQEKK